MRLSARLTLAATCCALVFTSACSDSTSPNNSQDAAHLAAHFDSLYVTAAALGDSSDGYSRRALLLSYLEVAPAFGATATTVTVTTAAGTEHWKGFELEDVTSNGGTPSDTMYLLVAYREAEAHSVLLAFYGADGSIQDGGIFANDTLSIGASDGSGTTSLTTLGSACTAPSSSLANPMIASLTPLTCNTANFSTSLSLTIPSEPNVDAALTSVSFTSTTFNGVRIVESATGQGVVRRVRALLRNAHSGNRL
jgi:hypothetical protein